MNFGLIREIIKRVDHVDAVSPQMAEHAIASHLASDHPGRWKCIATLALKQAQAQPQREAA